MKNLTFLVLIALLAGAYFFGDFLLVSTAAPASGSALNATIKGLLVAATLWLAIAKAKTLIKVNPAIALFLIAAAGTTAFSYEAHKTQRLGRRQLAKFLDPEIAAGAWIHSSQGGQWTDPDVLVGFTSPGPLKPANFRKIEWCNLRDLKIPGVDQVFAHIDDDQLMKTKFSWKRVQSPDGEQVSYSVLGIMPEGQAWFFKSSDLPNKNLAPVEVMENAREVLASGDYVDRQCTLSTTAFHKRQFNSHEVLRVEWDESTPEVHSNEILYDQHGELINGTVESTFVYNVPKLEENQKGFGPAGELKCSGFYSYTDGKKDGPYEFFYPGHIARAFVGQYVNGARSGNQKQFYPNGKLKRSWDAVPASSTSPEFAR